MNNSEILKKYNIDLEITHVTNCDKNIFNENSYSDVYGELTSDGLKACASLRNQNILVNVTLCFSTAQALLAAKAGASFISPFVGRLDDIGSDGMNLISEIAEVYSNYNYPTEILVASVRGVQHVVDAALVGADVATIPPKIMLQMYKHPLTDKGLADFLADWKSTGQSIL